MLDWPGPGLSVIGAVGDKYSLVVAAEGQPYSSRAAVHHRAGVADGDSGLAPFLMDHLHLLPGLAIIRAAAEHQINVTPVAPAGLAPFTESQKRVIRGQHGRRYAIGVVSLGAAGEDVNLFDCLTRPRRVAANTGNNERYREHNNTAGL